MHEYVLYLYGKGLDEIRTWKPLGEKTEKKTPPRRVEPGAAALETAWSEA